MAMNNFFACRGLAGAGAGAKDLALDRNRAAFFSSLYRDTEMPDLATVDQGLEVWRQ